ncbi:MAG: hypothetical protein GSR73_04750 [Desulfurococcales archaeon]|nr:hypothetical protein [Desulfurococcales archaeon]
MSANPVPTPGHVVCPRCKRLTRADLPFCTHCGYPINAGVTVKPREKLWSVFLGHDVDGKPYGLALSELKTHTLTYGLVDTGKTSLAKRILYELPRDVGFLVIDWEGEYGSLAKRVGAQYYRLCGKDTISLGLLDSEDPLWLAQLLREVIIEHHYDLTPSMEKALLDLTEALIASGADITDIPSFIHMLSRRMGWNPKTADALGVRLSIIHRSPITPCLRRPNMIPRFIGERIIVDLSRINIRSRPAARLMASVIFHKFEREIAKEGMSSRLRHLLVIEEAEELLSEGLPGATTSMHLFLMHSRKRGVGVLMIAHTPLAIPGEVKSVVGNVASFHITDYKASNLAAESLGSADLGSEIRSLDKGEFIIKSRLDPAPVRVKLQPLSRMDKATEALLESIKSHPHLTTRERRAYLSLNNRVYMAAVEYLKRKGVIEEVTAYRGSGRPPKLLQIKGMNPGAVHAYGVHHTSVIVENTLGVPCMRPSGGASKPDLEATYGRFKLAFEVETGSNINAGKYLRVLREYDYLFIVCVKKCMGTAKRASLATGLHNRIIVSNLSTLPQKLERWMERIRARRP